jgi:hypothetical protein
LCSESRSSRGFQPTAIGDDRSGLTPDDIFNLAEFGHRQLSLLEIATDYSRRTGRAGESQ